MRHSAKKFVVDLGWQVLFKDLGLSSQDILRSARLPLDLFSRSKPTLTSDEYFRLIDSLGYLLNDPIFPLRLGQAVTTDVFNPPLFACFCCPDLNTALLRLAQYKPLIGPLNLEIEKTQNSTSVSFRGLPKNTQLPNSLVVTEQVFIVHLARMATRERIVPQAVIAPTNLAGSQEFTDFFGVQATYGDKNKLSFSAQDARKPFLSANESMWAVFEPELQNRMADLEKNSEYSQRIRACLIETIASGQCTINDVALKLAVTPRTLQRRLHGEGTTFQKVLVNLREDLARHYLDNTKHTGSEISFLLGYDDPNSFFRAFHSWTGQTPERVRQTGQDAIHGLRADN